jgi:hypothetical protein
MDGPVGEPLCGISSNDGFCNRIVSCDERGRVAKQAIARLGRNPL